MRSSDSHPGAARSRSGLWTPIASHIPVFFIILGDVLLLQGMVLAAILLRLNFLPLGDVVLTPGNFTGIQVAILVIPIGFALAGLYPGYGLHAVDRLRRRVLVVLLSFAGMGAFDYLAQNGLWSRGILLIALAFALLLPIWDMIAVALLIRMRCWGIPVALFGPAADRAAFSKLLQSNPELGWYEAETHDWPPDNGPAKRGITVAVALPVEGLQPDVSFDHLAYRHILLAPALGPLQSHNVAARDIGPGRLILELQRKLALKRHSFTKRSQDVIVTLLLLPLALPITLAAAAAVYALSPAWPFYGQLRRGRNGKAFRMWKIRTMVPHAEKLHPALNPDGEKLPEESAAGGPAQDWVLQGKAKSDPRIIPGLGRFLRRFSIDELPQLWNVLCGDMSLVGPRPLPDYHLAVLSEEAANTRALIRPGMTGYWQVTKRADASQAKMEFLDTYYVRNWSLWLDIHILLRTVGAVITGRGAY